MKKLTDLRQHIENRVPELQRGPDRLICFIEDGQIEFWPGPSLNHQYRIPARIIVTDYRGEADDIIVPILEWLQHKEPGQDPKNTISLDVEVLSNDAVDLSVTLNLTERVIVSGAPGSYTIEHVIPQPGPEMDEDAELEVNTTDTRADG